MDSIFGHLTHTHDARSGRLSSWDQSGRNRDAWLIPPGETVVLADLEGPGCITHLWMTQWHQRRFGPDWTATDPDFYRKVVLKMTWDEQEHPSVLVPLGDFFCIGHSLVTSFATLPFTVSTRAERPTWGAAAALNCYLPMPFEHHARIELINESDVPHGQYFYIDYELYRRPPVDPPVYFHAQWQRALPTPGWDPAVLVNTRESDSVPNLTGETNYVILDAEGRGHYIGCNLAVANFQGSWWGEGDDMIFIDGEQWPPSLHGTGSEDYFNQAYGMQRNAFPMNGSSLWEGDMPGYQTSYRFHIVDPVHFQRSIRVTMEHGHANHLANDWSSTAYWYQTLPSRPFDLLPVAERLPFRHADLGVVPIAPPPYAVPHPTPEQARARQAWVDHDRQSRDDAASAAAQHADATRQAAESNQQEARRVRQAYPPEDAAPQ